MSWDPEVYLAYANERTRPAADLIARIPAIEATSIVDLGCGAGDMAPMLAARFAGARITGVDSSPEMLAKARSAHPGFEWTEGDAAAWSPPAPVDILFSNAALHWLDHHEALFPKLFSFVRPGGALAVQTPDNFAAPSHEIIADVAATGPWADKTRACVRRRPVAAPEKYHRLLAGAATSLDIWRTTYLHALSGDDAVFHWVKGSALRPFIAALGDDAGAFLDACRARLGAAYPKGPDGATLFPFSRLFMVAVRK